jgi:sodium transport system ATP-binding protein
MIQIQNLRKTFDNRTVVQDLSFEAPDGVITGLLGSNGAGKTTTLRMICGVLKPESGLIQIDDTAGKGEQRRRVGALLDHTGMYARLTARENLMYFGKLQGMPRELLSERVDQVLSTLGLNSIADQRTAGFSQGERMKTALGRAILHSPQNLILDEPTNGLDVPTIRAQRELLRSLRDQGKCILFSSHVLDEVHALCDRVVVISAGRLVAQGSPADLCTQTTTSSLEEAFVALTCHSENTKCSIDRSL